jgi:putative PEP-CTERM system TPR-repeat lipoprotein
MSWLLAALVVIGGCAPNSASEYLARAERNMAEQDYRAAAINLKNALQLDPENVQARVALGRTALELGDFAGAIRELRFAQRLGSKDGEVPLLLARALLAQREYDAVLKEVDPALVSDASTRQRVLEIQGRALLTQKRYPEAKQRFEEAVRADPKAVDPRIGLAVTLMTLEGFGPAKTVLEEARALEPGNPRILTALGELYAQDRQFLQAEQALNDAVELAKDAKNARDLLLALASLAEVQMALNKLDAADGTVRQLVKLAPESSATRYVQARVTFLRGDYDTARTKLEQLLAVDPGNTQAQLLLGAVNYAQGNLGQADMYLSSVVATQPTNSFARRLLAETRLRHGKPKDALAALEPAVDGGEENLHALAGWAAVQAGDVDAGISFLQQHALANPGDPMAQLQLASAYLSAGQAAQAVSALEALPHTDSVGSQRDLLLIKAHVRNNDVPAAIGVAERMVQAKPDDAAIGLVLASLLTSTGEFNRARDILRKASERDPANPAPILGLGRLDLLEGKPGDAERRFRQALALKPKHPAILTALAQTMLASGRDAEAVKLLEQVCHDNPANVEARVTLGYVYLAQRNFDKASALAQEAQQLAPTNPAALNLLAGSLEARGDLPQTISTLENAALQQPQSVTQHFNLARAYLRAGRTHEALAAARECVRLDPNHVPALALAGSLLLASDPAESRALLARIRTQAPDHPAAAILEGDLYVREQKYAQAAQSYARAAKTAPTAELAIREYWARHEADGTVDTRSLTKWLERNPEDVRVRMTLAEAERARGESARAIAEYERALALSPKDPVALNNLAWLYLNSSDARAEETARRAHEAAPDQPSVLDTYGWVLLQKGKLAEAEPLLRDAARLAPQSGEIQFHYATVLARSGKEAQARQVLSQVLAQPTPFEGREAAQELSRAIAN